MGVDREAGFVESLLALTQTLEPIVDLGFQTFEVFESEVEEVAGAAGRVEDFDGTKPPAEIGEYGDRLAGLTGRSRVRAAACTSRQSWRSGSTTAGTTKRST